jgi:hypothetical protein
LKRPLYVTLISWFFIIYAFLSLFPKLMLFIIPEAYDIAKDLSDSSARKEILSVPFWVQVLHAYLGSVIMVISGIFMLKGQEWARITMTIWVSGVLIITFLVVGFSFQLYTKSTIAIIIFFPLYLSEPNKYFKGN